MALEVINSLKNVKSVGRALAVTQKYSPQILTFVGVAGVVTAAVLGAKATLKLEDVVDKTKAGLDDIADKKIRFEEQGVEDVYSNLDEKRDVTKVYLTTAKDLTKLYALPVALGVVSISCIIGGQGIQYKRTVASVAAYKTLEESFAKYRQRVIDDFGVERDEEFRRGFVATEVVGEDGETTIDIDGDIKAAAGYITFFDANNHNWKTTSPEYNLMFVKAQETFANQLLNTRGHVFLNDIYDSLGMRRTREGAVVGWVLDSDGDNYIDFRIQDLQSKSARTFGTDDVDAVMLDFNVDGLVWNKI
jgi:hypothetical protein